MCDYEVNVEETPGVCTFSYSWQMSSLHSLDADPTTDTIAKVPFRRTDPVRFQD